jgi:hypothetical protein
MSSRLGLRMTTTMTTTTETAVAIKDKDDSAVRGDAMTMNHGSTTSSRVPLAMAMMTCLVLAASVTPAQAQQTTADVLSFLLTNRTIITGDFDRDAQAAAATRDTISGFLVQEIATLPVSSSSGGFTYRLDPTLGTFIRSSDNFGPFYTERSLTAGVNRASFGVGYQSTQYETIDGRDLRDGTLVSTAAILRGETQPFDIETVSLRVRTDTMTVLGNYGVTDRIDVGVAIPFVRLRLEGERVDTYRGQEFVQATGSASASGLGDIVARVKYNVLREGASGLAIGAETRLPTGDEDNLLGGGEISFTPRAIGSVEGRVVGFHGEFSYTLNEVSNALGYGAALTVAAAPRFTVIGELFGRRIEGLGRLTSTTAPHPRLVGVDTIRLTGIEETADRIVAVGGFKWNVTGTWLVTANILRPITEAGLNASWVPTVTFDYSFGG